MKVEVLAVEEGVGDRVYPKASGLRTVIQGWLDKHPDVSIEHVAMSSMVYWGRVSASPITYVTIFYRD